MPSARQFFDCIWVRRACHNGSWASTRAFPSSIKTVPRACQGDVQPSRIGQEPDALVLIRPDTRQNNHVLLAALKRVDGRHLDIFIS